MIKKYDMVVNFNMNFFNILKELPKLERLGVRFSITFTLKINDLK